MGLNREALLAAVKTRLDGLVPASIKVCTRRVIDWTQLPAQPAVVVIGEEQVAERETADLPIVWQFRVTLFVYARQDAGLGAPDSTFNAAILAVENAFQQPEGFPDVLGGLCVRAAITGAVSVGVSSEDGGQYVAEVPITITAIA